MLRALVDEPAPPSATGDPSAAYDATGRVGLSALFGPAAGEDVVLSEGWIARTVERAPAQRDLGRYRLGRMLGAGGFGVVYEAIDPVLRRHVAIKFVRARPGAGDDALAREAHALASVEHPNVVPVYDAGRHGDDIYLVMQLVDGEPLDAWLARGASTRRILEVFSAAGRGLAAVHAAGLSHCDFKPSNVLIGRDGVVRIVDFGLARIWAQDAITDRDETRAQPFGTPRYMSPEQHAGKPVDARTDIYSFALALLEALRGTGPITSGTASQIFRAKLRPEIAASAELPGVPSRVSAAIARALAPAPDQRPATIQALLAAIAPRRRSRARRVIAVVGALTLFGGAAWLVDAVQHRRTREACNHSAQVDGARLWGPQTEQALRDRARHSDIAYATETIERVVPIVAARSEGWQTVATRVCIAADVDRSLGEDDLARARWCIEQQRARIDALVASVRDGDEQTFRRAVGNAANLPDATACEDVQALRVLPVPPLDQRDRIIELSAVLSSLFVRHAMHDPQTLATAQDGLQQARELAWPPLVAAAQFHVGRAHEQRGDYVEAEVALQAAYFEALRLDAFDVALASADALMVLVGFRLARTIEGREWARFAESALARLPDQTGIRAIGLQINLAAVELTAGQPEQARQNLVDALSALEQTENEQHPAFASALDALAVFELQSGDPVAAQPLATRAVAVREAAVGPNHPDTAASLSNLAAIHRTLHHDDVAVALNERALAIRERAFGPDHPDVAWSLNNLGNHYVDVGDIPRAEALLVRAIAIRRKALGDGHPSVASSTLSLGGAYLEAGNYVDATARFTEAREIWRVALGDDHPETTRAIVALCRVALAAAQTTRAITRCEEALASRAARDTAPPDLAETRFLLAQALESRDRARARELAEQAHDACGRRDDPPMPCPAGVGQWLAAHPAR